MYIVYGRRRFCVSCSRGNSDRRLSWCGCFITNPLEAVCIDFWLVLSNLAEHLGLRTRAELLAAFEANGLRVVTQGLKPGERVVVNGLQHVRPGALVAPTVVPMDAAQAKAQAAATQVAATN